MHNILRSIKPRTLALIKRFKQEVAGVAAIEFAIIAPIMILLFFATIEVSTALAVNRKLARVSSTLGDLVTQSQTLTQADVDNIMAAASYVMTPYDHSLGIIITQISIKNGVATVDWSRAHGKGLDGEDATPYANGVPYTVPTKIMDDDTYLVSAKVTAKHTPLYAKTTLSSGGALQMDTSSAADIHMEEEIFLRPRIGLKTTIN